MQIGISTKKYNLINIFFIILTIFVTAVYIFYPLTTRQNYYKIYLGKESPNYFLPTIKGKPNSLLFNIDVNQIIDKNNWIINTLGGDSFQINVDQKRVFINISDNDIKYFNVIVLGNISNQKYLEIKYTEIDEPRIKTNLSSEVFYLPSNYSLDIAKGFVWNPFFSSKNSNIEIYENNYSYITIPLFKKIMLVLFIFIFIVTNFRFKKIVIPKIKFKYIFTLITQVLIISFFVLIAPIKSDDGRYYFSSKILKESNYYIDYLYPTSVPLGFTHALINSIIVDENTSILRMKLLPLVIVAVIWVLISSFLKLHINPKLNIFLFLNFVIFSYSFLSTIRPEPLQALFLTLVMILGVKKINHMNSNLSSLILISLISVSIHQTGLIIFFVTLFCVILAFKKLKFKLINFQNILAFALGLMTIFIFTNPFNMIRSFREFNYFFDNKFPGSYKVFTSFWREDIRFQHLLNTGLASNLTIFIVLLFFFYLILILILNLKTKFLFNDSIFLLTISAPFGLLFVPVKWFHYYGVLITPFIFLNYYLFKYISEKSFKNVKINRPIFLIVILLLLLISFQKSQNISDTWLPLGKIIHLNLNFFYLASIIIIFSIFFQNLFYFIKITLISIPLILSIFPTLVRSSNDSITWIDILKNDSILNISNCGILDLFPNSLNTDIRNHIWIAEPSLMLMSGCLEDPQIVNSLWELPDFKLGNTPIYDSQRLIVDSTWQTQDCLSTIYMNKYSLCLLKISHNY